MKNILCKLVVPLLLAFSATLSFAEWRDNLKEIQGKARGALDASAGKLREQGTQTLRSLRDESRTLSQNNLSQSSLSSLKAKHGTAIADRIVQTSQRYGPSAAMSLVSSYDRHGGRVGSRIHRSLDRFGVKTGQSILKLYDSYSNEAADMIHTAYELHGVEVGDRVRKEADRVKARLDYYTTDPVGQEQALTATISAAEFVYSIYNDRAGTRDRIVRALEIIEVVDSRGRNTNLHEVTKALIREKAPFLNGSSLAEDPVGFFLYTVCYQDGFYLLAEAKCFRTEAGCVSALEYGLTQSGLSAKKSIAVVELVEAVEATNEGNVEARNVITILESLRVLQAS